MKSADRVLAILDQVPVDKNAAKLLRADGATPEHVALVIEATENGVNENFNPHIQQARAIYRPQLDLIYSGQKSAADALGAVKERVEQALNAN